MNVEVIGAVGCEIGAVAGLGRAAGGLPVPGGTLAINITGVPGAFALSPGNITMRIVDHRISTVVHFRISTSNTPGDSGRGSCSRRMGRP